jgi:hypothetical protein
MHSACNDGNNSKTDQLVHNNTTLNFHPVYFHIFLFLSAITRGASCIGVQ